jgi:plastocyanin
VKRYLISIGVLVLALSACVDDGADPTGDGPTETVEISDFEFTPENLTVAVGTTVTWENVAAGTLHTSNSEDQVWASGSLNEGDEFSFTFEEAGSFPYFCTIHPDIMKGTVVVEE